MAGARRFPTEYYATIRVEVVWLSAPEGKREAQTRFLEFCEVGFTSLAAQCRISRVRVDSQHRLYTVYDPDAKVWVAAPFIRPHVTFRYLNYGSGENSIAVRANSRIISDPPCVIYKPPRLFVLYCETNQSVYTADTNI